MVASTAATSLAKISGDFSFCCSVFILPVESLVSTIFMLPVEIHVPVSACFADCVFSFCFCVVSLAVTLFSWTCSALYALFCNLFSGVFVPLFLP